MIGSDAYNYGRGAWQGRPATDAEWEALSTSTDHEEATPEQPDPLSARP